jgi:hypothetical protein
MKWLPLALRGRDAFCACSYFWQQRTRSPAVLINVRNRALAPRALYGCLKLKCQGNGNSKYDSDSLRREEATSRGARYRR